jgi:hypothetical protein
LRFCFVDMRGWLRQRWTKQYKDASADAHSKPYANTSNCYTNANSDTDPHPDANANPYSHSDPYAQRRSHVCVCCQPWL